MSLYVVMVGWSPATAQQSTSRNRATSHTGKQDKHNPQASNLIPTVTHLQAPPPPPSPTRTIFLVCDRLRVAVGTRPTSPHVQPRWSNVLLLRQGHPTVGRVTGNSAFLPFHPAVTPWACFPASTGLNRHLRVPRYHTSIMPAEPRE